MDHSPINRPSGEHNLRVGCIDTIKIATSLNLAFQVTKEEVDSYLPGKRIPHCELAAHPLRVPVTRLVHRLVLVGAKPPRNKFTLSYMPPIGIIIFSGIL